MKSQKETSAKNFKLILLVILLELMVYITLTSDQIKKGGFVLDSEFIQQLNQVKPIGSWFLEVKPRNLYTLLASPVVPQDDDQELTFMSIK